MTDTQTMIYKLFYTRFYHLINIHYTHYTSYSYMYHIKTKNNY
jgi:hypothetical protein